MSTLIRVKRCLEHEASDVLVVNCKKRKTHDNDTEITTLFQRTTTLESQEQDVLKYVKHSAKCELKHCKIPAIDLQTKLRKQHALTMKSNRYKVVNLYRNIGSSVSSGVQETDVDVTIVDVEPEKKDGNLSTYVYDLYCSSVNDLTDIDLNGLISVYPLNDDLVHDDNYENEACTDDSDSNDENNWRNDYPDESDCDSITEEDMLTAMNQMELNEENMLSSDDDDHLYNTNEDTKYHIEASAVYKPGGMYAKFKAKFSDNYDSNHSDTSENEDN